MAPATLFLAKLWGPTILVTAIAILVNLKTLPKIVKDMEKNAALTYISGFFILMLGVLLVTVHNIWNSVPGVIITIFGWGAVLKGAIFMVFPKPFMKFANKMVKIDGIYMLSGVLMIGIGVYLTYAGYFL